MNDSPAQKQRSADRDAESKTEAAADSPATGEAPDGSPLAAFGPAIFMGLFLAVLILWQVFLGR